MFSVNESLGAKLHLPNLESSEAKEGGGRSSALVDEHESVCRFGDL